ncbi:MAG: transglycosylase SLT domain-containing protein, partial [Gemmatimonadota bacterium]
SLGACASTNITNAPEPTSERWERIMQQMRADSAEAARQATAAETKSANPEYDGSVPPGIDLSRFELPIQYNERVQFYIDLYANRRKSVFVSWLRRMGRYRDYVEQRLALHRMPRELAYLALIESGYEADAKSHASAVGLWQFMAPTARAEGLEVSEYVDERRDPFRSTDAAIRHLAGLHRTFDSWYLAAAAYNSGATRIARLMKDRYGQVKGRDATFWEIQDAVPQETRGYVPGLIAATIIGEYPHLFGFDGLKQETPVQFETVTVPASTDLRAVARAANVPAEDIRTLNPHYILGMTPPDRESAVRLPVGSASDFAERFAKIPGAERTRSFARTHTVRQGETLSEIARKYGTTVSALQAANRIKRPNAISVGRKLTIPADVSHSAYGTD